MIKLGLANAREKGRGRGMGLLVLATLMMTCGGGGGGGTCSAVGEAACDRACACTDGPGCAIFEGGITASFDSADQCRAFFITLGCAQGDAMAYNDGAACLPLVKAASCTGTGTDAALAWPSESACVTPQKD
jgi:hypothetical protein